MSQAELFSFSGHQSVRSALQCAPSQTRASEKSGSAGSNSSTGSTGSTRSVGAIVQCVLAEPPEAPRKKSAAVKKISAATESALRGVYTRNLVDWLQREDDGLLNCVLSGPSECVGKRKTKPGSRGLCLNDFAVRLSRDPVLVLKRIIDSEIPEMAGIELVIGSEPACEFMGLALSGVPLSLAMRWSAAHEDHPGRPLWADVRACMTGVDRRPAMQLVASCGLWFTSASQLWALDMLCDQNESDVLDAVHAVIERVDAPTPDVVFEQMLGVFEGEGPFDWSRQPRPSSRCFVCDLHAAPVGDGKLSSARSGRGRARQALAPSPSSHALLPGSAEYSANPGNWGAKKKVYYKKRHSGGTRTIKAGTSYKAIAGKAKVKAKAKKMFFK